MEGKDFFQTVPYSVKIFDPSLLNGGCKGQFKKTHASRSGLIVEDLTQTNYKLRKRVIARITQHGGKTTLRNGNLVLDVKSGAHLAGQYTSTYRLASFRSSSALDCYLLLKIAVASAP